MAAAVGEARTKKRTKAAEDPTLRAERTTRAANSTPEAPTATRSARKDT